MNIFEKIDSYSDTDKLIWILLLGAFFLFLGPLVGFNKSVIYPLRNQSYYQPDILVIDSAKEIGTTQGSRALFLSGKLANKQCYIDSYMFPERFWRYEVNDSLPVWYNANEKVVAGDIYPEIGLVLRTQETLDVGYFYRKLVQYTLFALLFPVGLLMYIRYRMKINRQ